MANNVTPIGQAPKETYTEFHLNIHYIDGEVEAVNCSFYGTSIDSPNFMVFIKGDPADEEGYPELLVNTNLIKKIETIEVVEVEK